MKSLTNHPRYILFTLTVAAECTDLQGTNTKRSCQSFIFSSSPRKLERSPREQMHE